jgi:uncharacterized membrane protein
MQALARVARAEGPEVQPVPSWRIALSVALSLIGLGLSVYLTIGHFEGPRFLECADSGAINCQKVTTSAQSYVFGIPVAILGLGYWVVMSAFNSPWAWRAADRRIHIARLVLAVLGIGFVLYLLSAELLIIKAICLYCTGVHIITFAQLVLVMSTVPTMLGWGQEPARTTNTARTARGKR